MTDDEESNVGSDKKVSDTIIAQAPTGVLAAVITILVVLAGAVGIELPVVLATAIVIVPAFIVSWLKPRWARANGVWYNHPAAATAAAATLIVAVLQLTGVSDLDEQQVVGIIGSLTAIVGILTPRSA